MILKTKKNIITQNKTQWKASLRLDPQAAVLWLEDKVVEFDQKIKINDKYIYDIERLCDRTK